MDYKKLNEKKIGAITEKVMGVSKKNGKITMNDIKNMRNKFNADGKKQFKHFETGLIKVESGGRYLTFTDEEKFNSYFENKVKDPSKFYEFDNVLFYIQYE
jgi:hypothetical protein